MYAIALELLKRKFPFVEEVNNGVVVGYSRYPNGDLLPAYTCTASGAFTEERGRLIQIADMGSVAWNLMGLLCSFYSSPSVSPEERNSLMNAASQEEALAFFACCFGEDYVRRHLHFQPIPSADSAVYVSMNPGKIDVVLVRETNALLFASFTNNQNNIVYRTAFQGLKAIKEFESILNDRLGLRDLSSKEWLKLFAVYHFKTSVNLKSL